MHTNTQTNTNTQASTEKRVGLMRGTQSLAMGVVNGITGVIADPIQGFCFACFGVFFVVIVALVGLFLFRYFCGCCSLSCRRLFLFV